MSSDTSSVTNWVYLPTEADTSQSSSSTNSSSAVSNELGKDAFLKLLVAQYANQDPMSPTSDTEFISQLASFSSLEQMTNLNNTMEELSWALGLLLSQSLVTQGAAMIGKEAVWFDENDKDKDKDNEQSGIINSVSIRDGYLVLKVDGKEFTLDQISEIREVTAVGDGDGE